MRNPIFLMNKGKHITVYNVLGARNSKNYYGKEGDFINLLFTNINGHKFFENIQEISSLDYKDWKLIKFKDLPRSLQRSFNDFNIM